MAKLESGFQSNLIKTLNNLVGAHGLVIKTDSSYTQGIPDILILYKNRWAALECKRSYNSVEQPNQRYYINYLDRLSFASFISPETEEEVLNDLQQALRIR